MEPIQTEIAKQGCQAGSRPSPQKEIAAIDVTNTGPKSCTITITFSGKGLRATALTGEQIKLKGDQNGHWTCSAADMLPEFLPQNCRDHLHPAARYSR